MTELQKQLQESVNGIQNLRDAYHAQNQVWKDDQEKHWDTLNASVTEIRSKIDAEERANKIDAAAKEAKELQLRANNPQGIGRQDVAPQVENRDANSEAIKEVAFLGALRELAGRPVTSEQERAMRACGHTRNAGELKLSWGSTAEHAKVARSFRSSNGRAYDRLMTEHRAMSAVSPAVGGSLVPSTLVAQLQVNMLYYGPMLSVSNTLITNSGEEMNWPTLDDTSNTGRLINENGTVTSSGSITTGNFRIGAHKYTSDAILVPTELLDDSVVDISSYIAAALAERLGRIQNTHLTTGDGAGKATGVVTGASSGVTAASATTFTYDELLGLYHSVDLAYRNAPQAAWMCNDAAVLIMRKLKDTVGQYIWKPGVNAESPDTILGKPVYTNNDMATVATGNKTVLFGDFSKYLVRRVKGLRMVKLVERYADSDQVGFLAFDRMDAGLLNAGTAPIKYLVQA